MSENKTLTSQTKAELMKNTISFLYSKEGRSISYISRLLEINRKTVSDKIKEWNLPEAEPRHHMTPSTKKFLNKNRNLIKARLDADIPITKIAEELKVSRGFLEKTIIPYDEVLKKACDDYISRKHIRAQERITEMKNRSFMEYSIVNYDDEEWKDILGYKGYMVSNYGRVKHFSKGYHAYHLIKPAPNKNNGRLYVMLHANNKKRNIQLARLVALNFVSGHDEKHNTVNHEDGNVQNNKWTNLTWQTQSENNTHAYRKLNRKKVNFKRYKFSKIVYKDKYEFKTVSAFARFIQKSPTQTRRYLDEPERHDIKLIQ